MSSNRIKQRKVVGIFKEYQRAIRLLNLHESGYMFLLDGLDDDKVKQLMGIIQKVESALAITNDETTFFLYKEYLEKSKIGWWLEYYSRSTYYRHKVNAIEDFLICYGLEGLVN